MTSSPNPSPDDFQRIPGLFRRWELQEIFQPLQNYHVEEAGTHIDGTPLLAVYAGFSTILTAKFDETTGSNASGPPCEDTSSLHVPPSARTASANSGQMLTQHELAKRWKMSGRSLERWRVTGAGPFYLRLNGRLVYRLDDVLAFEENCRRRSTSDTSRRARRS